MTGHIDALADELTALIRARDLPGAARVLRRIEFEIARELDRVLERRGDAALARR